MLLIRRPDVNIANKIFLFFLSFNMADQTRVNKIAAARKYISSSSRKTSKYAFLIIYARRYRPSCIVLFLFSPILISRIITIIARLSIRDLKIAHARSRRSHLSTRLTSSFVQFYRRLIKLKTNINTTVKIVEKNNFGIILGRKRLLRSIIDIATDEMYRV